jgi:hypothetical protein
MGESTKQKFILSAFMTAAVWALLFLAVIAPHVFNSQPAAAACISYSSTTKTITVSCTTPTRLTDVNNAVHNSNILKKESPGVWLLSVKVVVAKNGNFAIDSTDTSWLKIASSSTAAYGLINYGSLKIDSVKITSWNVGTNTYA